MILIRKEYRIMPTSYTSISSQLASVEPPFPFTLTKWKDYIAGTLDMAWYADGKYKLTNIEAINTKYNPVLNLKKAFGTNASIRAAETKYEKVCQKLKNVYANHPYDDAKHIIAQTKLNRAGDNLKYAHRSQHWSAAIVLYASYYAGEFAQWGIKKLIFRHFRAALEGMETAILNDDKHFQQHKVRLKELLHKNDLSDEEETEKNQLISRHAAPRRKFSNYDSNVFFGMDLSSRVTQVVASAVGGLLAAYFLGESARSGAEYGFLSGFFWAVVGYCEDFTILLDAEKKFEKKIEISFCM